MRLTENLDQKADMLNASRDCKTNQWILLFIHRLRHHAVFKKSFCSEFLLAEWIMWPQNEPPESSLRKLTVKNQTILRRFYWQSGRQYNSLFSNGQIPVNSRKCFAFFPRKTKNFSLKNGELYWSPDCPYNLR